MAAGHGIVGQDMVWERLSDASQGYSEDMEDDEASPEDGNLDLTMRVAPGEEVEITDQDSTEACGVQQKDLATWTEHTQSQLSLAESLRRDASQVLCEPLQRAPQMSARSSTTTLSTRMVQEQLQRSIMKAEKLQRVLHARIESTRQAIEKVSQHISLLLAAHRDKDVPLQLAERRLELRAKRPPGEMIQDHLQEALEYERVILSKARLQLVNHIEAGQEVLKSLEGVKSQMVSEMQHKHKLLRLDRSALLFDGFHSDEGNLSRKARAMRSALRERDMTTIRQLMGTMQELQELSSRFCCESDSLLRQTRRDSDEANMETRASLRKRINETSELKRRLEKECVETGGTIASMEQTLGIMQKQLSSKGKWSKNQTMTLGQPTDSVENLGLGSTTATIYAELVAVEGVTGQLFERAMAAAGDGTSLAGLRQAEVMLASQSQVLQEATEKLQEALSTISGGEGLRRFNQVAEKLHLHQDTLTNELTRCRTAKDELANVLQDRCDKVSSTLEHMRSAREKLSTDLQSKTEALSIDVACSNVAVEVAGTLSSTAKKADKPAPKTARGTFQLPSPRPYRPPLHQETLETLKKRVRASAYTGGGDSGNELDVIFRRFDKDGSGQLDDREVRMALRRTLRVPPSMISDAQISSLCAMLDADKSGSVSIDELVDFIGVGPVLSQRTGKPLRGPGVLLSPINTVELSDGPTLLQSREQEEKVRLPRAYRPPLQKSDLDALRMRIKAAAYTGSGLGRQISDVFLRFDKDGSGQLEDHEVRQALRRVLRIPPSAISDAQISSLCSLLDTDCSGAVSINELVDFVGPEPEVSQRTGKRLQTLFVEPAATDSREATLHKLPGGAKLEPITPTADRESPSNVQAGSGELR